VEDPVFLLSEVLDSEVLGSEVLGSDPESEVLASEVFSPPSDEPAFSLASRERLRVP
jgi:hypothetical protein